MEKEEILAYLLKNIDCFQNVTEIDFYNLTIINTRYLGNDNNETLKVTPLLKQICNYALIATIITEEQLSQIASYIDDTQLLTFSTNIIEKCLEYIGILYDEGCEHPSVLNIKNIINGTQKYNDFNDLILDLASITDDTFRDDLIDFGSDIDEEISSITDQLFNNLINRIKRGLIATRKDLLLNLSSYAVNFVDTLMLTAYNVNRYRQNDESTVCIGNTYIHIFKKDGQINQSFGLTLLKALNGMAEVINKIEEYEIENIYSIDSECEELIIGIKESYLLYQSYKYQIIKHNYNEQKILEKCKKM